MGQLVINRTWAMPNKRTFSIKPIENVIAKYAKGIVIDPFANESTIATITNNIDPHVKTDYHLDALDFLKIFPNGSIDTVLYDPPYSPRQVSESYRKFDKTVNMQTTQAAYWANQKNEIARIMKCGGYVITCAWNSGGIGKKHGFEIVEILLVAHGGWHNDTIVTVERKMCDV